MKIRPPSALLCVLACSSAQKVPFQAITVRPEVNEIGAWWAKVEAKYSIRKAAAPHQAELRSAFLTAVEDAIHDLCSGRPMKVETPSISPVVGGIAPLDPRFGIPIVDVEDSRPIEPVLANEAKEQVLTWYAARGIYPINSTKRKHP